MEACVEGGLFLCWFGVGRFKRPLRCPSHMPIAYAHRICPSHPHLKLIPTVLQLATGRHPHPIRSDPVRGIFDDVLPPPAGMLDGFPNVDRKLEFSDELRTISEVRLREIRGNGRLCYPPPSPPECVPHPPTQPAPHPPGPAPLALLPPPTSPALPLSSGVACAAG